MLHFSFQVVLFEVKHIYHCSSTDKVHKMLHQPTSQEETLFQWLCLVLRAALATDTGRRPPGGAYWDCKKTQKTMVSQQKKKKKYYNLADTHPENGGLKSTDCSTDIVILVMTNFMKIGTKSKDTMVFIHIQLLKVWCFRIPYLWRKICGSSSFWHYICDIIVFKIQSTLYVSKYTALSNISCLFGLQHKAISPFGLTRLFCTVSVYVEGRGHAQRRD